MKGSEIINHITRDKMPDIGQIRERCMNQSNHARGSGFRTKPMRLSTAAALVLAFLVFSTAAYAVGNAIYQRINTGGTWDIVIFPDDSYGRQAYHERRGDSIAHPIYNGLSRPLHLRHINLEMAQFINENLEGQIFNADGTAIDFELAVPMSNLTGQHHLDNRGNVLYTVDGYAIGTIYIVTTMQDDFYGIWIRTKAEVEQSRDNTADYEEAMVVFDRPFRLPTAHMELFQSPIFSVNDIPPYFLEVVVLYNVRELRSIFDTCPDSIRIFIEREKNEYDRPARVIYRLGETTTHDIAGTIVYEINVRDHVARFIWTHDGLVYTLQEPPTQGLAHEQIMDIIRSMLE